MTLIVDASVAIKWAIDEDDRAAARALLRLNEHDLVAPDFALIELANVIWKKERQKEIGEAQARAALPAIAAAFSRLIPLAPLVERALDFALELRHPVYDCLYLAAAEAESAPVVTADQRLADAVHGARVSSLVILLRDFAP